MSGRRRRTCPPPTLRRAGRQLVEAPVEQLHPDPENLRGEMDGIEDLAQSIDQTGLLQPIVARRRGGRLIVLAGHRRLEAVKLLGWETVEVVISRDMAPQEVVLAMLVENGQREDIDPIEEALALNKLRDDGMTMNTIAEKIGRSIAHVSTRLSLLTLPPETQEEVRAGVLSIAQAIERARNQQHQINHGSGASRPVADRGWHFGHEHPLKSASADLCQKAGHSKGRRVTGGIACGECWETVIRADERAAVSRGAR